MKFLILLKLRYKKKRREGTLIEYHKIHKRCWKSNGEKRCEKEQKILSFYNKVAISRHNAKERLIFTVTDKISYSSF